MKNKIFILLFWSFAFCPLQALPAKESSGTLHVDIAFPFLQFELPVFLASPPMDTRWIYLLEQGGKVKAFVDSPTVDRFHTVLDISPQTKNDNVLEGLLCIAFHPRFSKNRRFFVSYIAEKPRRLVVSEFKIKPWSHSADIRKEKTIFTLTQPANINNGGALAFGPDGFLYFSVGISDPQALSLMSSPPTRDLSGAILRIDVDHSGKNAPYAIPMDNPFVTDKGERSEVWAFGLQNVSRLSFDAQSQSLYATNNAGPNGQKIHLILKGRNYVNEPSHVSFEPSSTELVLGGNLYRGAVYPSLKNSFLISDFMKCLIWAIQMMEEHTPIQLLTDVPTPSSLLVNLDGQIYVASYYGGKIYILKKSGQ